MYVGLDISKNEIVCIGKDKDGSLLHKGKYELYTEEIDRLLDEVGRDSLFTLEPSTHGVFVHDYLVSKKIQVAVANSSKIRLIAKSEKKTDWEDANILCDLLRTNMLPKSYLPDKLIREGRDLVRHRKSMVDIRTGIKSRMRAILAREGIRVLYSNVTSKKTIRELNEIAKCGSVQRDAFNKLLCVSNTLDSIIDDFDVKIDQKYNDSSAAQLLDTIPGISHYSAVHIASSIGDIKRFPSDEELASYAGVVPKIYQSGNTRMDRGRKHGDKLLTWILIQDANAAIRTSKRFRKYYTKKKRKGGHNKAIIATARKMVEIIHIMLTRGEPYCE